MAPVSPALQADSLHTEPPGKPLPSHSMYQIKFAIKFLILLKQRTESGTPMQMWLEWPLCQRGLDECACLGS